MSKLFTTLKHLEQRQKKSGPTPEQEPPFARSCSSPPKMGRGKNIIALLLFFVVSGVAATLFLPRFLTSQNRPGLNPSAARPTSGATVTPPKAATQSTFSPENRNPEATDQQKPPRRDPPVRPDHADTMVPLHPVAISNSAGPESEQQVIKIEQIQVREQPYPFRAAGNPVPMSGKKPLTGRVEITPSTGHHPTTPGLFVSRRHKQLILAAEESRNRGDFAEAARLYRKVWEKSGDPWVANNLAASLMMLGKHREALAILRQALEKHPGDADLEYNLEIAQTLDSGQLEE